MEVCLQARFALFSAPRLMNDPIRHTALLPMVLSLLLPLAAPTPGSGAEIKLKFLDKAPPTELGESIRAHLQSKAVQLLDGEKAVYEFWFARELTLTKKPASPAKVMEGLPAAALIGAVSVPKSIRDYRDDELAGGVFTMRFALQPQDGNHLGTSEYPYFAVLVPAKSDATLNGIADYKPLVKASSKPTSTDHPVILSLRPASGAAADIPQLSEPAAEHKALRVRLPGKISGTTESVAIPFELVYDGVAKK